MIDPQIEQDEVIETLVTWEVKLEKRLGKLASPSLTPERVIQSGLLLAACDLIETLRETLEEHGLPD
jgi:hypothetical protein